MMDDVISTDSLILYIKNLFHNSSDLIRREIRLERWAQLSSVILIR